MSDQSRALPDRPNLRYLKLEAKRRLSAGEFTTLHEAQLAIAREHGQSSWTALKEHIEAAGPASHALTQVRWVMSRFAAADTPEWTPPDEEELRQHFDDHYLSLVPPDWLTRLFSTVAEQLREDLTASRYEDAAAHMVLEPLGMSDSWFPPSPPTTMVTGHRLTDEGVFEPVPTQISVVPAAGGLWTTAADLVRFGIAWSSLLPDALAREALRPQAEVGGAIGGEVGLGWNLVLPKDVAGHPGAGSGFSASLIIRPGPVSRGGQTWVILTNRQVVVETINERLALPIT